MCFISKEMRVNVSYSVRHEKHQLLLKFDNFEYTSQSRIGKQVYKAWFPYIVIIVGNRKHVQAYREQINCKNWLKFITL